jgi:hypothetical protein
MKRVGAVVAALALVAGCCLFEKGKLRREPKPQPPTFSQYHLEGWDWGSVDRVLVLPFLNESEITQPRVAEEIRAAFRSELQQMGRFEVIPAAPDDKATLAVQIHRGGRFDEEAMLALARTTSADVVVHGIITHYSPYPRPRLGIVLQAVSPEQAKVVASVDGVWDTTDNFVAERGNIYYRQRARPRLPVVRNNAIVGDDRFAEELWRDSPALFQRWVFHEATLALLGLPVPGISSGMNSQDTSVFGGCANPKQNCQPVSLPAPVGNVK